MKMVSNLTAPVTLRYIIYGATALLGGILVALGYTDPAAVDGWLASAGDWAMIIASATAVWHIGEQPARAPRHAAKSTTETPPKMGDYANRMKTIYGP